MKVNFQSHSRKVQKPVDQSLSEMEGTEYVPPLTHTALRWSVKEPLAFLPVVTDAPLANHWQEKQ